MTKCAFIPNFLKFYNILWRLALPFLRRNHRLAPSFSQRVRPDHLGPADIWIQAASAGEAFLALSILTHLDPDRRLQVLVTTTTDQGLEILEKGLTEGPVSPNLNLSLGRFIFDIPDTVRRAVRRVDPRVMVLLETELWPAHLHVLKENRTRILVVNGRLSPRSCRHYRLTSWLWQRLAPDRILAISADDMLRYQAVFPRTPATVMDNIKFDIMDTRPGEPGTSALSRLLPGGIPLSILASVRRQEEPDLPDLISRLLEEFPNQVIAVFPRHMHRVTPILKRLKKKGLQVDLGSALTAPVAGPGIILWDRFGELRAAYRHATTVFVGGSLRSLGGQNFVEPAVLGIPTVIGPFWDDFRWVGTGLFEQGIVTRCRDWQDVAMTMTGHLKSPGETAILKSQAEDYIASRQGGSRTACQAIASSLEDYVESDAMAF